MKRIANYLSGLTATDFIVLIFCQFLSSLNIIYFLKVETWYVNIIANSLISAYVILIAFEEQKRRSNLFRQLHLWYLVPLVFIFFKELYTIIEPIRGKIYDGVLILIDRFIFRADPTIELHKIANPFFTELLQIVYGTFFFLPIILGINLIRQKKIKEFDYSSFIIVLGFCLSFIGYILVPAIGPRFTLHDFANNNFELPGIFITDFLREIVNSGESIPSGTLYPAAVVQRDAFPSGHTQMTLLVMFLAVKFKSRFRWFFIPNGILLIFATVYLRYHYVTDLIGGLMFMLFTLWSGKYIYNWWNSIIENQVIFNQHLNESDS